MDIENFEGNLANTLAKIETYIGAILAVNKITASKIEHVHEKGTTVLRLGSQFHTLTMTQGT
jgi:hypothetical protein